MARTRESRAAWSRVRTCDLCGARESVRRDNPSERCKACAARLSGAKGVVTIKAKAADRAHACPVCDVPTPPTKGFCSVECRVAASARISRRCKTCSKGFELLASRLPPINKTTNSRGNFCCRPCYIEWLRHDARHPSTEAASHA